MPFRIARAAFLRAPYLAALVILPLLMASTWPDDSPVPEHRRAEASRKAEHAQRMAALSKAGPSTLQLGMDTGYVQLDLSFDVAQQRVDGTVVHDVRVVGSAASQAEFDFDSALTATAVRVAGGAATFSHVGNLLTVDLDRSYSVGETYRVEIDYGGVPDTGQGAFGYDSANGSDLIWSLSEPFGARTWWPCKDSPSDKADSVAISFTVPSAMIAVSNGTLDNVVDLGATKRYEWTERFPIAPYLVSIAAHPYVEQTVTWTGGVGGPLPVTVWSYSNQSSAALSAANTTVTMLQTYEGLFGPWPFPGEKYGQAQFNWGGGMEHQTATSLCCWGSSGLIAHELTHQWFGDQITCDSFTEIWTNEGFATYGEALWREAAEGPTGYFDEMNAAKYFGGGTIRVPASSLGDFGRIFNSGLSYNKGSWVLHMLRGVMGDATFFQFLQDYTNDPAVRYSTATTADVQRVAEATSGLDLANFFDQWIDQEYFPTYGLTYQNNGSPGNWSVDVTLEQLQTNHVFDMPITLRVVTASGSSDHVVTSNAALQNFSLPSTEAATDVVIDPDGWVLHTVESAVDSPTFHRGVLLVNGVDWSVYGAEIVNAHADSVFTGNYPFEFWDLFPAPAGGYDPALPAPLGNGSLPSNILGQFSTVVWVGNNYQGDLQPWADAAILSFLNQGGNVLLLSRLGQDFLPPARSGYLGLSFAENPTNTIGDATANHPALVNMTRIGPQSLNAVFETTFSRPEATLLFTDTQSFATTRALGVWEHPTGGGSLRPSGGHFAYVAGRPYRWEPVALRANTQAILAGLFNEPANPTAAPPTLGATTHLLGAVPNPFNPRTEIRFVVTDRMRVEIEIYDLRGRLVRTLLDATAEPGEGSALWDGRDDQGQSVASGVYTVRFLSDAGSDHRKITLVR